MCNTANCPDTGCLSWEDCLTKFEEMAECPLFDDVEWDTQQHEQKYFEDVEYIDPNDAMAYVDRDVDVNQISDYGIYFPDEEDE